jgi:hypothetical protein
MAPANLLSSFLSQLTKLPKPTGTFLIVILMIPPNESPFFIASSIVELNSFLFFQFPIETISD